MQGFIKFLTVCNKICFFLPLSELKIQECQRKSNTLHLFLSEAYFLPNLNKINTTRSLEFKEIFFGFNTELIPQDFSTLLWINTLCLGDVIGKSVKCMHTILLKSHEMRRARAAVVHLNFRAGSTFPVQVCTVLGSMDRTSRCNKVDAVRLYAS